VFRGQVGSGIRRVNSRTVGNSSPLYYKRMINSKQKVEVKGQ
jgi:hypothetical protein